jgi:hypothetical protein
MLCQHRDSGRTGVADSRPRLSGRTLAALSRMVERGLDDYTVMSISGHSSTRMQERYTHPTVERKRAALETFDSLATNWPQSPSNGAVQQKEAAEAASFLSNCGGRREDRTRDLRIANAALSQLS